MSGDTRVQERVVHGFTWQIILQDWGIHRAEANLAFAAACAQLETMSERDAVQLHAALLKVSALPDAPVIDLSVEYPTRAIEIERSARRAALSDWPSPPRDTHQLTLGAIPC